MHEATCPHPGFQTCNPNTEIEEAVVRGVKRTKTDDTVSLSRVGKTEWDHISRAFGLMSLKAHQLPSEDTSPSLSSTPPVPSFSWTDANEGSQSDRCVLGIIGSVLEPAHFGNPFAFMFLLRPQWRLS
jgi:hypothetical protein